MCYFTLFYIIIILEYTEDELCNDHIILLAVEFYSTSDFIICVHVIKSQ